MVLVIWFGVVMLFVWLFEFLFFGGLCCLLIVLFTFACGFAECGLFNWFECCLCLNTVCLFVLDCCGLY